MTVGVLLAFLYMLWGGLLWISAHGEKGKAESARNVMTQAAIGLIVLSASIAIMVLLQAYLNVRILNFKFP
jgi:cytochrome bd-type quinol oxidase subunit 2